MPIGAGLGHPPQPEVGEPVAGPCVERVGPAVGPVPHGAQHDDGPEGDTDHREGGGIQPALPRPGRSATWTASSRGAPEPPYGCPRGRPLSCSASRCWPAPAPEMTMTPRRSPAPAPASLADFLESMADDLIVPSYQALTGELAAADGAVATLCSSPSADRARARCAPDGATPTWPSTAPGPPVSVPPPIVGSWRPTRSPPRPDDVEALLASTAPVDPSALAAGGAHLRGLNGVEVGLPAPGSDALATARAPAVRLRARPRSTWWSQPWTRCSPTGPARGTGPRGWPAWTATRSPRCGAIVNEVGMRLHQVDIQGLRNFVAMGAYDELGREPSRGSCRAGHGHPPGRVRGWCPCSPGWGTDPG